MKEDNGNPVPSMVLQKEFNLFINNEYGTPTNDQLDFIKKFMKWSDKQNGVETNKVQPCSACGTKTSRIKLNSNEYVCIACSH